jgi:ABC-type antimicrobial peptide transport system permease subunit
MVFASNSTRQRVLNIALQPSGNGETWKRAIDKMTKAYKETYPDNEFEYSFLDDGIAELYKAEQDLSKLLRWAAGLAVFISCLGLFGLVIYTSNQRVKEIGIRKVLGASVRQIVTLLSRDFLKLVLIALAIAIPIGWWATQRWLGGFAFRTNLSWWIFGLSGVVMILLALVTLSFKTINAAMNNPVDSLRNE